MPLSKGCKFFSRKFTGVRSACPFHGSSQRGTMDVPKFSADTVILHSVRRRPNQKYCCSPKVKHFFPLTLSGLLRHCFYVFKLCFALQKIYDIDALNMFYVFSCFMFVTLSTPHYPSPHMKVIHSILSNDELSSFASGFCLTDVLFLQPFTLWLLWRTPLRTWLEDPPSLRTDLGGSKNAFHLQLVQLTVLQQLHPQHGPQTCTSYIRYRKRKWSLRVAIMRYFVPRDPIVCLTFTFVVLFLLQSSYSCYVTDTVCIRVTSCFGAVSVMGSTRIFRY